MPWALDSLERRDVQGNENLSLSQKGVSDILGQIIKSAVSVQAKATKHQSLINQQKIQIFFFTKREREHLLVELVITYFWLKNRLHHQPYSNMALFTMWLTGFSCFSWTSQRRNTAASRTYCHTKEVSVGLFSKNTLNNTLWLSTPYNSDTFLHVWIIFNAVSMWQFLQNHSMWKTHKNIVVLI